MRNNYFFLVIIFSPLITFSQSYISADSANKIILNGGDCSDITFTKVQKLPSLKISIQAFEDTLTEYLKSKGTFYNDVAVKYRFVVSCHSEIKNIQLISSSVSDEHALRQAILKFSTLWLPARQNNFIVNSYVSLDIDIKEDKLDISISQ